MKKAAIISILLVLTIKVFSQVTFIGFDTTICGHTTNNIYTYSNVSGGNGSTSNGFFYVFKNGIQVFYDGGFQQYSEQCHDLIFINDSVGFLVYTLSSNYYVKETFDYGVSWIDIGSSGNLYYGLYILNPHFAYLVAGANYGGLFQINVVRCSDIQPPQQTFIRDTAINSDIYKTDNILGNTLCFRDSLNILLKKNTDTITYHINILSNTTEIEIKQTGNNNISIYPNPANNTLNITNAENSNITIYNLLGEEVMNVNYKNMINRITTINVSGLNNGTFMIKFFSDKNIITKKLIIDKFK